MMRKFNVELTEEQLSLVARCLEDVCRFACGQVKLQNTVEEIVKKQHSSVDKQIDVRDEAQEKLQELRSVLFPNLHPNSSYGYNANPFIGNTYQIYRTMKHHLLKDTKEWNVYHSPALPSGTMGIIKITEIHNKKRITANKKRKRNFLYLFI